MEPLVWLIIAYVAVIALIVWKGVTRTPPPPIRSPSEASSSPMVLTVAVARNETIPALPTMPTMAVMPTMPEPSVEAFIPDKDAWEEWTDELYAADSREIAADLAITYRDRNGKVTNRDIRVEKYARTQDGGLLAAFCHLRKSRRPFQFTRIQFAADRTDGTKIKDLGAWLDVRYEASPKGARDRFITEHEPALGALFFVAKADDAFDAKEKAAMRSFCAAQGLDDSVIQTLVVDSVAGWRIPSRIAYGKDLRALLERDESYRNAVLTHAQAIVNTGKTVRDEETRALERMRREMKLVIQSKR